jgi:hypothetical protein
MVTSGTRAIVRTFAMIAVIAGTLCACAAPTTDERAKYMDARYGDKCSASVSDKTSPRYQECVSSAYKTDRKRAIENYNTDMGRTGLAVLVFFH